MENKEPVNPVEASVKPKKSKMTDKTKMIIAIVVAVVLLFVAIFSIVFAAKSNNDKKNNGLTCDCEYCSQMFAYYNYLIESGQIKLNQVDGYNSNFNDFVQNDGQVDNNTPVVDNQQTNNNQQSNTSNDPSKWTTAQIVETYKHAAARTHNSVTSYQQMTLRQMSAPGINSTLLSFAEGVMAKALQNNSKDIPGITGGHTNLSVSDVKAAKAYKSGNNIVIEMLMKEQTDKGNGNMYSGTVGHAISVVGDIDSVIGQFSGLGMDATIADQDCTLHYANPILKVTIDSNGRIINGTWSYVVNITLKNLTISAMGINVPVEQATAIVDFIVVLNGGFKG